jgi:hypothetical protein
VDPFAGKSESPRGRGRFAAVRAGVYEAAMDAAAATELAFWILGPVGITALIFRLGRHADQAGRISPGSGVARVGPGWTEAMFTDGTYFYGRAFSVNGALIDAEAMVRIQECGYAPMQG